LGFQLGLLGCDIFIGARKAAEMTVPAVNAFADELRAAGRSGEMIKRVVRSLGGIFKELRRRGMATTAPTDGIEFVLLWHDDPRERKDAWRQSLSAPFLGRLRRVGRRCRIRSLEAIHASGKPTQLFRKQLTPALLR